MIAAAAFPKLERQATSPRSTSAPTPILDAGRRTSLTPPPAISPAAPSGPPCGPPAMLSFAACAPSPTAPSPSSVGIPSAAVKFPSDPPPVSDSSSSTPISRPNSCAFRNNSHDARRPLHRRPVQPARHLNARTACRTASAPGISSPAPAHPAGAAPGYPPPPAPRPPPRCCASRPKSPRDSP